MPWKHNGIIIKEGKSWSDGTYKHPYNWASAWSAEDKKKFKLVWEEDEDTSFDNRFYISKNLEKKLDDQDAKDQEGNQIFEIDGKTKVINKGLKTIWIEKTKKATNQKLQVHDWQVVRKSEKSIDMDSNVVTYRDAVRSACDKIEKSIKDCKTLADFIKLFDQPMKDGMPTGNAPIYDFPEEI